MFRKILGRRAEETAVKFLRKKGYKIMERNFSCRIGEMDIVARDDFEIVFIEVRSSTGYAFHDPLESITNIKMERLQRIALLWLNSRYPQENFVRFDIITVVFLWDNNIELRHFENAF